MPFVEQAVGQVTIRPRKLGYLVRAGNAGDVRLAIGYASTEWGGVSHPIVPVRRARSIDPGYWQLLETLRPEVLIDYGGANDDLIALVKSRLGAEVITPDSFAVAEPGLHAMATVLPYSLRGRTLFTPPPGATLAIQAALGILPADPDQRAIWEETAANIVPAESWIDILDGQLDVPSPMWVTRQQHAIYRIASLLGFLGGPVVLFCYPRPSVAKVLWFWNMRAAGFGLRMGSVLWLPTGELGNPAVSEIVRRVCRAKPVTKPDLVLLGDQEGALSDAAEGMGFERYAEHSVTFPMNPAPSELAAIPMTYWTRIDPREFTLTERFEGTRVPVPVTVTEPATTVNVQSPFPFHPRITGKLRIDIDEIETLKWPRRPAVARLLSSEATWTQSGLGLIVAPSSRFGITLRVPGAEAVVDAILAEKGWKWHLSDKGRYAQSLLRAVPGRERIDSICEPLALRVLRSLGSLSPKKAVQVLREIGLSEERSDRAVAGVLPALVPTWKTANEIVSALNADTDRTRKDDVVRVLNRLVGDQIVRRAFRFACPNCGLQGHILLGRAGDRVECEGCAVSSPLIGPNGEPDLAYGLNSLVDRALDQDCLGHLHTQDWLRANMATIWSVPGAELTRLDGAATREIDVLALSRTAFVVAEVKNAVTGFSDQEVRHSAGLAHDIGADALVMAALDVWDEERIAHVKEIAGTALEPTVIGLGDLLREGKQLG